MQPAVLDLKHWWNARHWGNSPVMVYLAFETGMVDCAGSTKGPAVVPRNVEDEDKFPPE
jgi:hypothetical protein